VLNGAAAANKKVQAAIGERDTMSNAAPGIESGVTAAVRAKAASDVENNLTNQEEKITQRNYDIGRQNYENAVKSEEALPEATMNPVTSAASPVVSNEDEVRRQAGENEAASRSWMGLVGGLAGGFASGLGKSIGSGGR
jgi:hypothetical protein